MERGREGGDDLEMGMGWGKEEVGERERERRGEVGEAEGVLALLNFNSLTDAAPFPPLSLRVQRDLLNPSSELVP